jgi:cytochrome d ubiquinol oxidase subunit II
MTFLQILWFVLIFVLITGYFVLDGFDLGVGVLYPVLGKDEAGKSILRRAIGPVWDGNEVWLLTAGGALFAAFGPAYATTFSGFYLAIMLVLFGLILRAVALELRAHDAANAKVWDACFFVGSLLPALLFGVAVGNVIEGIQLNANGDYTAGFFALLNPFALVCGLLGLAMMCAHGCAWIAVKTEGDLHDRAAALRSKFQIVALALFALASVLPTAAPYGGATASAVCFVFAILYAVVTALGFAKKNLGDIPQFILSAVGCVALVGLFAANLFPCIVPASDMAYSLTVANSSGSEVGLGAMAVIALIGVPLVLLYHVIIYRKFAGKVTAEDEGY